MELKIIKDASLSQINQIISLYQNEGWWTPGPDNAQLVERIIRGSHCFIVVLEGDSVIGMGRAISDGVSDSYIQDVTVKKEYRGKKLGSQIINLLVEVLNRDGLRWIGLIAEKNSHPFYQGLGFSQMTNSIPMLKL